ncbi:MAG: flavin reductase family protein [Spirochaetaceae bacterium]
MEIQIGSLPVRDRYKLLTGTVVPRPIAWISTRSSGGLINLAPFSYFNAVASNPPTLSVSFSWNPEREDGRKDTLRNLEHNRECVVNIVSEPDAEFMNLTAGNFPASISEVEHLGIALADPMAVATPRVATARVSFECVLDRSVQVGAGPGSSTLVLLTVEHVFVADELIDSGLHIDIQRLAPVARLAGNSYSLLAEPFQLERRTFSALKE